MTDHRPPAIALLILLAPLVLPGDAEAESVTLFPSKDNTLVQVQPGSTELSNGQGDIFVGRTNQDGQAPATISMRRGLLAFDVAGVIPLGATIIDATLTLWDVRGLNGSRAIDLHRVLADWGEGGSFFNGGVGGPAEPGDATWFSRAFDPAGGPSWSSPGGDFDPTVSGSTIVTEHPSDQEMAFSWLGSTSPGMIADIQSWLDDPASNFGWILRGDESQGQTAKRFRSGEAEDPAFRPTLTISYSTSATVVPEPGSIALAAIGAGAIAGAIARRRRGPGARG